MPATIDAHPSRHARIAAELDRQRRSGPLREIVIPPCPELLTELQQALALPEPDLNAVARIAMSDVAMAATLIRNANGAMFASGQPVQTVGQAMNRLGLKMTVSMMTTFLVRHAIRVDHPQLRDFWEQSSEKAAVLATLATQLPGLAPDLAHTYGLFCHVGMPVLLQSVRGYGSTLVEAKARIDRSFIDTENANHRTDHAVVGALVARVWKLAPEVMVAIRLHHDLASLGAADIEPEAHTLVAAGLVAEYLLRQQHGLPAEADWQRYGGQAVAWLQINTADLEDWEALLSENNPEATAPSA